MLITDQVATAPCTDCIQARRLILEAKPVATARCTDCIQPRRLILEAKPVATDTCTECIQARRLILEAKPVSTAPCTDCIQARRLTLEAKPDVSDTPLVEKQTCSRRCHSISEVLRENLLRLFDLRRSGLFDPSNGLLKDDGRPE